jgi:acetyl-CoA synthetase
MSDIKKTDKSELYYPSQSIIKNANIKEYENKYKSSIENPEAFWEKEAKSLHWHKKWDKVLDSSKAPFYKWFTNAKTNIIHNAIDRHLKTWRKNKLAMIWEGEPGDSRVYSYL